MGPAEVAAWGLLGSIWDILELVTEAVGNAAEVRCSLLLGSGQPEAARLSAYKSILIGLLFALIITSCLFIAGENVASWLTSDEVLQGLVTQLIPLFGIGNIAFTMGTMAWTLVGSQGRYRLSTVIGIIGSFFITIPLAALFSVALRIDLQGQTAAVVIGYMTSGTVTSFILFRSDWDKLSQQVIQYNKDHDIELSDDEVSSNESESSHSSESGDAATRTDP